MSLLEGVVAVWSGEKRGPKSPVGRVLRVLAIALICGACLTVCGRHSTMAAARGTSRLAQGAQNSERRIFTAAKEHQDEWLTPGGDANGSYYSPLAAINGTNVTRLGLAWDYQLGTDRGLEATPIVVDGIMYAVGNWGRVYALDAANGTELWTYNPGVDGQWWGRYACCDVVNRGLAVAGNRIYVGSLDGYLHALDARTGKLIWKVDTLVSRGPKDFHYFISGAPVLAGKLVVIGNGGSDFTGARGFISAFDAGTGAFKWRFFTVPRDPRQGPQEEPHLTAALPTWSSGYDWSSGGGGSAWDGLAYDPQLRLVYAGTAHASPYRIELRPQGGADQLYTDSILAIHADTGELAWHYQTTPGDGWDYDATAKFILAKLQMQGRARKVLMQANKNGFFYVLDRATGEFLSGRPFAVINWTKGLDPRTYRPIPSLAANWQISPKLVFPAAIGAHGWQPMSYSPQTGLVYIPVAEAPMVYVDTSDRRAGLMEGNFHLAFFFPEDYAPLALESLFGPLPSLQALSKDSPGTPRSRGYLRAFDPRTGKLAWEVPGNSVWDGGILSTGGNLVIRGDAAGILSVYLATSGKLLKTIDVGTSIMAAPMSYRVNGTQYISMMAGYGGGLLFQPFPAGSAAYRYGNAGRIVTFKLDGGPVTKPEPVLEQPSAEPPTRYGTPVQIAEGEVLYNRYCARCHVFGRGLLPDLRRMQRETHLLFYEIVLHGVYQAKGMARWDDVLSRAGAESIHAYLVDQAWQTRHSDPASVSK